MSKTQTGAKSNGRAAKFISLLSLGAGALALAASIWIIVPAPSYQIWLFSVAASEWSFAPAALAVFGIFSALIFGKRGAIKAVSIFLGALALSISLYPFFSALAAARRHNVSLSLREYTAGFPSGGGVVGKETFSFAEIDGKPLDLDVYSPPENIAKNGASVIVVHGGSWNAGARSDFPQWNAWLAREGFTVFDIDYRTAPQPNFSIATGDVKCAVLWIKKNAARFGVAPDRIVLLGRSAGAHLALLAAYSAGDARFPPSCPNTETNNDGRETVDKNTPAHENSFPNENVRAVVSFYAPTDLIWDFDNPANEAVIDGRQTLARFLGGNPHESAQMNERFASASPTARVSANSPPTLLIHGGQDQLVKAENMDFLAEKLAAASVPHQTVFIGYAQHGFDYNSNGWGAQTVKPVLLGFLRENTR